MFSRQFTDYTEQIYLNRLPFFGGRRPHIEQAVENCLPDEKLLMKFLYGTMPLSDAGEYDSSIFYAYVSHALFLAETVEWLKDIPEEIFLHYVLYYRVNSEAIEDCRSFFFSQLYSRIKGLTAREAALEVNYWCAENGSYRASDDRTISPMTMYRSGKGRCGEESVFAVTAFRSVGIPARQIYVPRWAHCDDNHAWVEVYVDRAWHFLGACEPEEVLNKGWFSHASSRALLVHSLTFSDYGIRDEIIGREGQAVYINRTAFYARTRKLNILVQDKSGHPIPHARVFVEILNMAEYSPAASLLTDKQGKAEITLGLGDIHLHAEKDGFPADLTFFTEDKPPAVLCLPMDLSQTPQFPQDMDVFKEPAFPECSSCTIKAPKDAPIHPVSLTRLQKEKNRRRLKEAERLREQRINGYFQEDLAEKYPDEREILRFSAGNFMEIYNFLSKDNSPDRLALLHSLSAKDYQDARADVLENHLKEASVFGSSWEEQGNRELYIRYLLCPRIYREQLTDYRRFIRNYFTEEQKTSFIHDPQTIWAFIRDKIKNHSEMDYETLCPSPESCLRLSHGSLLGQKVLFVAICRTLGIPARLHPVTLEAEWYDRHGFCSLSRAKKLSCPATLVLSSDKAVSWKYYQHWTIGYLKGCRFCTLNYPEKTITREKTELLLAPGTYRLLTANRLPSGNQQVKEFIFCLNGSQRKEILLRHKALEMNEMLVSHRLEDFYLNPSQNNAPPCLFSSLLNRKTSVLAFLQEGEEPTEHVLNELLAQGDSLFGLDTEIFFILRNPDALKQKTLQKTMQRFPQIRIAYGDFDELAEPIARRLYLEPGNYPLLAVVRKDLEAVYSSSGYRVGTIGILEELLYYLYAQA